MKPFHRFLFLLGLLLVLPPLRAEEAAVRVVSQTVGTDELLLALAGPGQIASLSHLSREPQFSAVVTEAKAYPMLDRGDAETILKYRPTLLLAADYSRLELVEQVRRTGVKVILITRYHTLDDAFANLRLLATELGGEAPAKAEAIIADCTRRVAVLDAKLKGVKPVRVIAPSTYGVIAGADTTFADLCAHAGAVNLADTLGGLRGHQAPPIEKMLTWPVDRVVVEGGDDESALAPYLKLPPYQFMDAVRQRRIARIEAYMLSSVSHHRVEGYEMLAKALHPEVFE
ncbi:MAG: ABC transporter substrate-binding protein [Opitutaceae bacterium]|jgi:iron complex transport system substrate-binding protein